MTIFKRWRQEKPHTFGERILHTKFLLNSSSMQDEEVASDELYLAGKKVGCEGCADLIVTLRKDMIVHLDLSDNAIWERGAMLLASGLSGNRNLRVLLLKRNNLRDKGVSHLASGVRESEGLLELDLSANFIFDDGVHTLMQAISVSKTCKLKVLNLSGNKIGTRGKRCISLVLEKSATLEVVHVLEHTEEETKEECENIEWLEDQCFDEVQKTKTLRQQYEEVQIRATAVENEKIVERGKLFAKAGTKSHKEQLDQVEQRLVECKETNLDLKSQIDHLENRIKEDRNEIKNLRDVSAEENQRKLDLEGLLKQKYDEIAVLTAERLQMQTELAEKVNVQRSMSKTLESLRNEAAVLDVKVSRLQRTVDKAESTSKMALRDLESIRRTLDDARDQESRMKNEISLIKVENDVQEILANSLKTIDEESVGLMTPNSSVEIIDESLPPIPPKPKIIPPKPRAFSCPEGAPTEVKPFLPPRPKSVSLDGIDREVQSVDFREILRKGVSCSMKRKGFLFFKRWLWLSDSLKVIHWAKSGKNDRLKAGSVPLWSFTEICLGSGKKRGILGQTSPSSSKILQFHNIDYRDSFEICFKTIEEARTWHIWLESVLKDQTNQSQDHQVHVQAQLPEPMLLELDPNEMESPLLEQIKAEIRRVVDETDEMQTLTYKTVRQTVSSNLDIPLNSNKWKAWFRREVDGNFGDDEELASPSQP